MPSPIRVFGDIEKTFSADDLRLQLPQDFISLCTDTALDGALDHYLCNNTTREVVKLPAHKDIFFNISEL